MCILVDTGADLTMTGSLGNNVVIAAASSANPLAVQYALILQHDPNVINTSGQTPLHLVLNSASGSALENMLKVLAQKGARNDIKNHYGKSSLDIASDSEFVGKQTFSTLFNI